ncbi:vasorin [Ornithorhynchus anatinus]|uniref:Vasorin n=1 Tax=Ornithorhynchus anatinus TaxID=9258 RepID=A0A6I8NNX0_ORNAN|nr:vasorin [Ornithorhynchus anatinus]
MGPPAPSPPPRLPPPLLLLLLLLLSPGPRAQACPAGCQCNQPQTVFCIARKGATVPDDVPPDTAGLYVFENGITALAPGSFAGLSALQLLDLSQNKIAELEDGVFQPLANLSNLDLSANRLQEITNGTFRGLRLLERLYLDRNRLRHIHPQAFDTLESLLELKLQDNQLRTLPALRLPRLLLLDLSHNRIAALEPAATFGLGNVESLKLAGLGLSRLDEELFRGLRNLHELNVSDNRLERVPPVLRELRGLTRLSLAGNTRITQLLPGDLDGLVNLQELDLSNLSLQGFPRDFFGLFPRLRVVSAARNPFNCVCQLSWFGQWAHEGRVQLRHPEETRCHFPPKNAGKLLQQLDYADFGCPATTAAPATAPPPRPATLRPARPPTSPPPVDPGTWAPTLPPRGPSPSLTPTTAPAGDPGPQLPPCPPHTCLNGGTCQVNAQHHLECLCPEGFSGLYCEGGRPTLPGPTQALARPPRLSIQGVSPTSLRVGLQSYIRTKAQLKGIRLTYRNLSGPDKRPVTLSLPASLAEYTVTQLRPNATYSICVGPLGGRSPEEACGEARTPPPSQSNHAPVTQTKEGDLPLMIVPALAALLLGALAAAGTAYCLRRRGRDKGCGGSGPGLEAGPLELEGVKARLEDADSPGGGGGAPLPEGGGTLPGGSECEVPLMRYASNNNGPPVAKPSYF